MSLDKNKIIRFKHLEQPLSKEEMESKLLSSNVRMTHSYEHFYKIPGANLYHRPFAVLGRIK